MTINPQDRDMFERRLAQLIIRGDPFTIDDITDSGTFMLDRTGDPNSGQNAIGALINGAAKRGLIEFTGQVRRSTAPRRKGGAVRVWQGTEAGWLWARNTAA